VVLGPHEGGEGALRALNRNVERVFNPDREEK
jgi:hypothetical protein